MSWVIYLGQIRPGDKPGLIGVAMGKAPSRDEATHVLNRLGAFDVSIHDMPSEHAADAMLFALHGQMVEADPVEITDHYPTVN